jgi:hypothetical protein
MASPEVGAALVPAGRWKVEIAKLSNHIYPDDIDIQIYPGKLK